MSGNVNIISFRICVYVDVLVSIDWSLYDNFEPCSVIFWWSLAILLNSHLKSVRFSYFICYTYRYALAFVCFFILSTLFILDFSLFAIIITISIDVLCYFTDVAVIFQLYFLFLHFVCARFFFLFFIYDQGMLCGGSCISNADQMI